MESVQKKVLVGVLAVLVIALLIVLFMMLSRNRYEQEGDRLFERDRYEAAVEKYVKAQGSFRLFDRGGVDFKIGLCYLNLGDKTRAMDFFFKVIREHRESANGIMAARAVRRIHEDVLDTDTKVGNFGQDETPLVVMRRDFQRSYRVLLRSLKKNQSGVSAELREAYQEYKLSFKTYQSELKKAADAHREAVAMQERLRKEKEAEIERAKSAPKVRPNLDLGDGLPEALQN